MSILVWQYYRNSIVLLMLVFNIKTEFTQTVAKYYATRVLIQYLKGMECTIFGKVVKTSKMWLLQKIVVLSWGTYKMHSPCVIWYSWKWRLIEKKIMLDFFIENILDNLLKQIINHLSCNHTFILNMQRIRLVWTHSLF